MAKIYSSEIKLINDAAIRFATGNNQTQTTTVHMFLAARAVLKSLAEQSKNGQADSIYATYYTFFSDLLQKYNVTGENCQKYFEIMYPKQQLVEGQKLEISPSNECNAVFNNLKKKSLAEKRTMGLADLMIELFEDLSYDIHAMLEMLFGSSKMTDDFSAEMRNYFISVQPKMQSIEDFEKIPELKNLNQYVAQKKMTFVNCQNVIDQMRLGLSCKTTNSVALVGPAGSGKTMSVYAFCDAINRRKCEGFNDKIVYELNISDVVSGSRFEDLLVI